jgi:8-oxo-dGTP pyrophosphatase MutT (NUDIX family)
MRKTESAGGIVRNVRGEIALVKNGPDFWGFPKGHVDEGEDILTAAIREIREETGLHSITLIKKLGSYERYRGTPTGDDTSELKHIHMFLFDTAEEALMPEDESNPEARWVHPDEVGNMLTHTLDKAFFLSRLEMVLERDA